MNLTEAVSDLIDTRIFEATAYPGLYVTFMVLLDDKLPREDDAEKRHVKADTSGFPGNARAFSWLTDVRAAARTAETDMRRHMGWEPLLVSGTDVATIRLLRRLPELAAAVHQGQQALASARTDEEGRRVGCSCPGCHTAKVVGRLVVQAREILGEVEPWARYVKEDGSEEPCWICGNRSLRVRRLARQLVCVFPTCRSEWDTETLEYISDGAA